MYECTFVVTRDFMTFPEKKSVRPISESSLRLLLLIIKQVKNM